MSVKEFAAKALPVVERLTGLAEEAIPEPKSGPRRLEMVLGALTSIGSTLLGLDPPRDLLRGIVEASLASRRGDSQSAEHCSHCCPKRVPDAQ